MEALHTRTLSNLRAVVGDLIESLLGTFPDCTELGEWCSSLNAELELEGDELQEVLKRITSYLMTSVPHKMVKYDRAVLSITGNPLNVYQVLMYRDAATVAKVFPRLQCLRMDDKIKSLSKEDTGMFWQFVHEALQLTLRATQTVPSMVPTTEQIAENIERRRRQRDQINNGTASHSAMSVTEGVDDLWRELCHTRNVKPISLTDEIAERVARLVTAETTCETMRSNFPELGATEEYSEESLSIARRIGGLFTMKNAIPTNMMNGIEKVASSLVRDINNGKVDFASLDVESIGEQVLKGVGEGDVNDFANNLEKILPALQSMGGGFGK